MIRLTYASSANEEWHPEDLLKLLKQCRTNNGAKNVTGILLYSNGTFFQVLEGSDIIPVKLVVATALMAISRKVIVFDYKHLDSDYISASSLVVIALGVTYMLIQKNE